RLLRLHEVLHLALQLELLRRRRRWRRRLVRRDPHVPVIPEARPRRNQPAHRHVLFQAAEVIHLARNRRFGDHPRRRLERRGRDERVGRERRLGDAEQQRTALRRTAAIRDHALVLFHEPEAIDLLLDQELGVADVLDLHPPHHLTDDDLDVLVVDVDALQAVDLLDLVDEIAVQRLLAEDRQDVVRVARTVHERLARADAVAFLDVYVHAARQRVLTRLPALLGDDDDLPLPLDDAAVADDAVDLGDDGRLAGFSRLEQLHPARQAARDVLRLRRLARDLGEDLAGVDPVVVLDHEVRVRRHVVLARHLAALVADLDRRLLLLVGAVHDDLPREAGDLVHFLVIRDVGNEVLVFHAARILGEDRERVGIPLDEHGALLDHLAVAHLEARAVDDRIALAIATLGVLDDDRAGAVHDDELALAVGAGGLGLDDLQALIADRAGVLRVERRLLA